MRVLIVEDEPKLAGLLRRGLVGEGLAADAVGRGEDALWRAAATEYDASCSTSCCRASTASRRAGACAPMASGRRC